ncbi:acyl-CoA desaturase [Candidatus Peribacteria bacterium]|nr:acyl-CoA desaturase [Candidatus Peribacteria bacterium]
MDYTSTTNHFPELRKRAADEGLFHRAPMRSLISLVLTTAGYIGCFVTLAIVQNVWFVILDAICLAIICGQFGFLMHDAGHHQIFRRAWKNTVFGSIAALANGTSLHSWVFGHNEHHEHPNHEDLDPDIDIYFLAYSEKQVDEANPILRFFAPYQALYATVLYTFVVYFMRYGNIPRLIRHYKPKEYLVDLTLMALWHVAYFGTLYFLVGFWNMLLFAFVHHAVTGLHLALAFAPNHKGMPMFQRDDKINWFTKQVVTSRNIYSHPLTNFFYGGLNFQIEHHLFPTMPRVHLKKAHEITRAFCKENDVDYCETSIIESYKAVYTHLAEIGQYAKSLRKPVAELQQQLHYLLKELEADIDALTHVDELRLIAKQHVQKIKAMKTMQHKKLLQAQKEIREISSVVRASRLAKA